MVVGYADGYNRYLTETPVDRIPGWCRGQPWVRPITAIDLARRGRFPAAFSRAAWTVSRRVRDGDRHRGATRDRATRRHVLAQPTGREPHDREQCLGNRCGTLGARSRYALCQPTLVLDGRTALLGEAPHHTR